MSLRILIAGGDGQVGKEFADLAVENVELLRCKRSDLDITQPVSIQRAFEKYRPDAVINAAAYTAVDRAESEPDLAFAVNAIGAGNLAQVAQTHDIPLLHISTDYVFSGDKATGKAWLESDICEPRSVYGHSKRVGEEQVLDMCGRAFVMRTSWVFGRYGNNFPKTMLRLARERDELRVVGDQYGCPTHAADIATTLVKAAIAMMEENLQSGIYHYAGAPTCSWHAFASAIIERAFVLGLLEKKPNVISIATHEYPTAAQRPMNSEMCCKKLQQALGISAPQWNDALDVLLKNG